MERMKFCSASFNARCSLNVRHKLSYVIFKISTLVTDETLICSFEGCGVGFRVYCDSTSSLKNIFLRVILSFQKMTQLIILLNLALLRNETPTAFQCFRFKLQYSQFPNIPGQDLTSLKFRSELFKKTSEHSVPFFLTILNFELSSNGKYFSVFSKGLIFVNKANYVFFYILILSIYYCSSE